MLCNPSRPSAWHPGDMRKAIGTERSAHVELRTHAVAHAGPVPSCLHAESRAGLGQATDIPGFPHAGSVFELGQPVFQQGWDQQSGQPRPAPIPPAIRRSPSLWRIGLWCTAARESWACAARPIGLNTTVAPNLPPRCSAQYATTSGAATGRMVLLGSMCRPSESWQAQVPRHVRLKADQVAVGRTARTRGDAQGEVRGRPI